MPTQVIVWSHRLHHDTIQILKGIYDDIVITEILYHNEDRAKLETEIDTLLNKLKEDNLLNERVVLAVPSTSIATALVIIGIFRETGLFPDIINLIQFGDGRHRPIRNNPIISGQDFWNVHKLGAAQLLNRRR